jgi:hypothetical protein
MLSVAKKLFSVRLLPACSVPVYVTPAGPLDTVDQSQCACGRLDSGLAPDGVAVGG